MGKWNGIVTHGGTRAFTGMETCLFSPCCLSWPRGFGAYHESVQFLSRPRFSIRIPSDKFLLPSLHHSRQWGFLRVHRPTFREPFTEGFSQAVLEQPNHVPTSTACPRGRAEVRCTRKPSAISMNILAHLPREGNAYHDWTDALAPCPSSPRTRASAPAARDCDRSDGRRL
jgi:hypothetical protein